VARTIVLNDETAFTPLCIERAGGEETQLFVKEVKARRQGDSEKGVFLMTGLNLASHVLLRRV
jgi:hypothetical protein